VVLAFSHSPPPAPIVVEPVGVAPIETAPIVIAPLFLGRPVNAPGGPK
jgi:hypothetical protein